MRCTAPFGAIDAAPQRSRVVHSASARAPSARATGSTAFRAYSVRTGPSPTTARIGASREKEAGASLSANTSAMVSPTGAAQGANARLGRLRAGPLNAPPAGPASGPPEQPASPQLVSEIAASATPSAPRV